MRLPPFQDSPIKDAFADDQSPNPLNRPCSPIIGSSPRRGEGDGRRSHVKLYGHNGAHEAASAPTQPDIDSTGARLEERTIARSNASSPRGTRNTTLSPGVGRDAKTAPPMSNSDQRSANHNGPEQDVRAISHTNAQTPSLRGPDPLSSCKLSLSPPAPLLPPDPQYPIFATFLDSVCAAYTVSVQENTRLLSTLNARFRELKRPFEECERTTVDMRSRLRNSKSHKEQIMSCFTGWHDCSPEQRGKVKALCQEIIDKSEKQVRIVEEQYEGYKAQLARVKEEKAVAEKEKKAFCVWADYVLSQQLLRPEVNRAKSI